jgi:hypothetical protein
MSSVSTFGSQLTDSLAMRYRASRKVVRRFVDGHWVWKREDGEEKQKGKGRGERERETKGVDCIAEDGEEEKVKRGWSGWFGGGWIKRLWPWVEMEFGREEREEEME